jgi:16S rRNA (adenine(1408)-N(1))-methyltransferase
MPSRTEEKIAIVRGGGADMAEATEFAARASAATHLIVDLGTGDGRYVLRTARARPDALVIGIDPVSAAMTASAGRAARKPARGGAANAVFVTGSLEQMPGALRGLVHELTVNFPWGSLLRAVGSPEEDGLRAAVDLLAPGGTMVALLNASAAEQEDYADRLDLPPLEDQGHVDGRLVPGWRSAGLDDVRWRYLDPGEDPPRRTTWGQRLVRGSRRSTLLVSGRRPSSSTAE